MSILLAASFTPRDVVLQISTHTRRKLRDMRFATAATTPAADMLVVHEIEDVRREIAAARQRGDDISLVPTMGALHAGHLSLVQTAREECGYVAVSIFVNPTQFGPNEDFEKYPRVLEADLAACRECGVDLVFVPERATVYPENFSTFVEVEGLTDLLEGKHRPGHFQGVATVVLKLLNIVQPDIAYFGRKDFQQQTLIRRMCSDLDVPVEVRVCPTVRESDGLALSSRNRYLSADERVAALSLSKALQHGKRRLKAGETDVAQVRQEMRSLLEETAGVVLDYVTIADPATLAEIDLPQREMIGLVAAKVGPARLIDNLPIELDGVS